ncbi:MAG: hypothetical protein KKG73_03915 [Gammaproteobacteria bacterium]|nr:hypothetical protein [Gammaproteobacteria bacterium]
MINENKSEPKKKGFLKKLLIVVLSAVAFLVIALSLGRGSDNTGLTEDQKRWDRGEFTEEEIAEIRAEEEREDRAKEEILDQAQGN